MDAAATERRRIGVRPYLTRFRRAAGFRMAEERAPLHGVEQAILDVAAAVRPELPIVDGIVAMEGNGPDLGRSRPRLGRSSSGTTLLRPTPSPPTDGFTPEVLAYLSDALPVLGQGDRARIAVRGEDPSRLRTTLVPTPGFGSAATGSST